MIDFGKHVKRRRLALGLTQAEVAETVGASRPWLVALEKGEGNPPAEKITALAITLHEDPKDYLKRTGRVALTAEDLAPVMTGELSPEMADAIERAVSASLEPLLSRIDQLVELIEQRQDAG